jgi:hypothetical protein
MLPLTRPNSKSLRALLAGMLLFASGCATSPREVMTSWVSSMEWFHPEYEGTTVKYEEMHNAWYQEQAARQPVKRLDLSR